MRTAARCAPLEPRRRDVRLEPSLLDALAVEQAAKGQHVAARCAALCQLLLQLPYLCTGWHC